ncbi:MAG: hypothetical protein ABR514_05300 [Chthoniobacterales bacterium]
MNARSRRPQAFVVAAALSLNLWAVEAQTLPDAATAAQQLYKHVVFEDVIKAASKSKTHDGGYLSFGAPYPKQVLSVWVADETHRKLPGAGALVGRTVQIRGMVNPSPTGPMIYLESPAQFRLLPVDDATISKPQLEGKGDRHQFVIAIRQHLSRKDFDTIEGLGADLHESHERFVDGTWMLDAFFGAFILGTDRSSATFAGRIRTLAEWKARHPDLIVPILAEARFRIDLARKWRAIAAADEVAQEGQRHYDEELAAARQILETNPQAKASPDYFVLLQDIALRQRWSKADYFRLFGEAVSREPEYDHFYSAAAHYLFLTGAKGEWEAFAEEQRRKLGGPAGDARYARIAWSKAEEYRHHLFDQTKISWEKMAAGFDALIRQHPDSNYLKNVYANFAWEAKDRARLRAGLRAIKAHPDMDIWVNLENVQFAEKFANDEHGDTSTR